MKAKHKSVIKHKAQCGLFDGIFYLQYAKLQYMKRYGLFHDHGRYIHMNQLREKSLRKIQKDKN